MRVALVEARAASDAGEVPVGAVVVRHGQIIGRGRNAPVHSHDPSAHAEIRALRMAATAVGNYRLDGCELFVTLEPCAMCAGAMLHARLARVVFGAADPKTGAAGSVVDLFGNARLNHQTRIEGGLLSTNCAQLLQGFFQAQRQRQALAANPLREDALRTSLSRFEALPTLPGVSHYIHDLPALNGLRLHYVDAGPPDATHVTLCLHGYGSWSQVWQQLMPERVGMGARVLALDLIGFGKSDKPKKETAHTLIWHAQVVWQLIERLDVSNVVVLEPANDALRGMAQIQPSAPAQAQSLGQLVMALAGSRVVRRSEHPTAPMTVDALNAPYPDQGHRAAQRAWANPGKPVLISPSGKTP